jgi:glycosyltransferase involved in cell wall biosynthesis
MRILILTEGFPPETKSCSTLFFELAETLVKRGHQVSVITRMPRYNVADGTDLNKIPSREIITGIKVRRMQTPPLARDIPIIRGLEHFILGWIFFWGGLFEKFDIVLSYSPPLPLCIAGYWLGRVKRARSVANIQDLYPQTVIDLGLLKNKYLIAVSKWMERFIYKRSDALTVHSSGNSDYVIREGAAGSKVKIVHNWVDTELIKPGEKNNDFSKKYDLDGRFVVSFAGVMGFAQGLEVIVKAAEKLKDKKEIVFIMVGDGVKRPELEHLAADLKLNNLKFISTQPRDLYPQVLHASDICLVTLGKDLLTPVVPGKLLSIMASGRPVVASIPLSGDTPKIINDCCCGIAVEAGRPDLLAEAILKLYNNRDLAREMGQNGRQAAEKLFSRSTGVSAYENIFYHLTNDK